MCEFHESICNGFGDSWWTDNPIYFSSIDILTLTDTTSDIWEGQLISVSNHTTNKQITIGNIYRPPRDINENYEQFNKEFTEFCLDFNKQKGKL